MNVSVYDNKDGAFVFNFTHKFESIENIGEVLTPSGKVIYFFYEDVHKVVNLTTVHQKKQR